jgi:hypothetical protein
MNRRVRDISVIGKMVIALMLVFAIVGLSATPALCGGHGGGHGGGHSFGHYGHGRYVNLSVYHPRYYPGYGWAAYRPYNYYYYPVAFYAPSPVVYAPPPAGISLIFPVSIH